jgi:hypothetical protein
MAQRLPSRFPVGTKFVIEARPRGRAQVYRRHLELPDGTVLPLPERPQARAVAEQPRRRRTRR